MNRVELVYTINRKQVKIRMAELNLTYKKLAVLVSALSHRRVGFKYLNHIVLGRRTGRHRLPFIAQALDLSERKLFVKPTRLPKMVATVPNSPAIPQETHP